MNLLVINLQKKIIQISDIHFGEKTFSPELKNNLLSQITDENPDLIIVSGDLTTQGYAQEYDDASEFLDELRVISEAHVITGNHDARNIGLSHFEKQIGESKFVHTDSLEGLP